MAEKKDVEQNISKEDLAAIIAAAVRTPRPLTELELFELEEKRAHMEQERKRKQLQREEQAEQARLQEQTRRNELAKRQTCTHEHEDGTTHCAFINDGTTYGYLICQLNQCIIRPSEDKGKYHADIYDTAMFNRINQKAR